VVGPVSAIDATAAAAPTQPAPRHGRWRTAWPNWVPKTLIVTVGLTLATAWVFPALTHQWQDRQKARELSAGLVTQISKQTSQTLVTSDFFSGRRAPFVVAHHLNQQLFNQLDLDWRDMSAEIAAQLQAYYSPGLLNRWHTYARLVEKTYFLATTDMARRAATIRVLREHFGERNWQRWHADLLRRPWMEQTNAFAQIKAYLNVSGALLAESAAINDAILRDHPAGFSTQPRDIIHDLLP
jgi:hypothetical protein